MGEALPSSLGKGLFVRGRPRRGELVSGTRATLSHHFVHRGSGSSAGLLGR